eukprot:jgi/Mesen1/6523/ME000332S05523
MSEKHTKEREKLLNKYGEEFALWKFWLENQFGLLFYGFGSKKNLLEKFATTQLKDGAVVEVRGYLPDVNVKEVLHTIVTTVWDELQAFPQVLSQVPSSKKKGPSLEQWIGSLSTDDLLKLLCAAKRSPGDSEVDDVFIGQHGSNSKKCGKEESVRQQKRQKLQKTGREEVKGAGRGREPGTQCRVYVVVHNIDGPGLREVQPVLAKLAACECVHLVASIDNVKAPLLWTKEMADVQFNWKFHHTPTYAPYVDEAAFIPPLLTTKGAVDSSRDAALVLHSLTPNARSVFFILAECQMASSEKAGLPFEQWYTMCREKFLVTTTQILRTHLTEFKDHELVRSRRGLDGQDCLYTPLSTEALVKLRVDVSGQ